MGAIRGTCRRSELGGYIKLSLPSLMMSSQRPVTRLPFIFSICWGPSKLTQAVAHDSRGTSISNMVCCGNKTGRNTCQCILTCDHIIAYYDVRTMLPQSEMKYAMGPGGVSSTSPSACTRFTGIRLSAHPYFTDRAQPPVVQNVLQHVLFLPRHLSLPPLLV